MKTIIKIFYCGLISLLLFAFTNGDKNNHKKNSRVDLVVLGHIVNESFDFKETMYRIYKDNEIVESGTSNRLGYIEIALQHNSRYLLEIASAGFVTKKIYFNTFVPENYFRTADFDFEVSLISKKMLNGNELCDFDIPFAVVYFNSLSGAFDYDKKYTDDRIKQEEKILSRSELLQPNESGIK